MKYCPKCKVNVHHQLDNCPLCGSYLDPKDNNDKCAIYADIDERVKYPVLHEKGRSSFFKFKFNQILFALLLVCVTLNLILTPKSYWSAYVAMGFVFVLFCVMLPINTKMKLLRQIRIDVFVATVIAIALEFAISVGKFEWITVEFVLPWIYVAAIILVDVLIIFQRTKDRQIYSTLIYCTIFAIVPQIMLWIAHSAKWYTPKTLINFVIFFAVIVNMIVVFVVCYRSLKEEMERNLNV